jgi:hypothetical protein
MLIRLKKAESAATGIMQRLLRPLQPPLQSAPTLTEMLRCSGFVMVMFQVPMNVKDGKPFKYDFDFQGGFHS